MVQNVTKSNFLQQTRLDDESVLFYKIQKIYRDITNKEKNMNDLTTLNASIDHKGGIGDTSEHFLYLLIKAKRLNLNINIIRPFVLFRQLFSILGFKNYIKETKDLHEIEGEHIVNNSFEKILYGFCFGFIDSSNKILYKLIKKRLPDYRPYGIGDIFNIENTSTFDAKTIEKIDWASFYEYDFNLSLKNENKVINKEIMQKIGINDNDWYVCAHIRTGHFHGDHDASRNSDIGNYIKAFKYIESLGGKVVRLGDIAPLPHSDNYIDYPNSEYKSQYMDLYLIKHCKFYIGTNSGIMDTAYLFHKPVLTVNSTQLLYTWPMKKVDKTIYRYIINNDNGKQITYKKALEYIVSNLNNGEYGVDDFSKINCHLIENTNEDILLAVQEFILNLEENTHEEHSHMDKEINKMRYLFVTENKANSINEKYRLLGKNFTNGGVCDFFEKKYFDF